jgi:hypothetical protein
MYKKIVISFVLALGLFLTYCSGVYADDLKCSYTGTILSRDHSSGWSSMLSGSNFMMSGCSLQVGHSYYMSVNGSVTGSDLVDPDNMMFDLYNGDDHIVYLRNSGVHTYNFDLDTIPGLSQIGASSGGCSSAVCTFSNWGIYEVLSSPTPTPTAIPTPTPTATPFVFGGNNIVLPSGVYSPGGYISQGSTDALDNGYDNGYKVSTIVLLPPGNTVNFHSLTFEISSDHVAYVNAIGIQKCTGSSASTCNTLPYYYFTTPSFLASSNCGGSGSYTGGSDWIIPKGDKEAVTFTTAKIASYASSAWNCGAETFDASVGGYYLVTIDLGGSSVVPLAWYGTITSSDVFFPYIGAFIPAIVIGSPGSSFSFTDSVSTGGSSGTTGKSGVTLIPNGNEPTVSFIDPSTWVSWAKWYFNSLYNQIIVFINNVVGGVPGAIFTPITGVLNTNFNPLSEVDSDYVSLMTHAPFAYAFTAFAGFSNMIAVPVTAVPPVISFTFLNHTYTFVWATQPVVDTVSTFKIAMIILLQGSVLAYILHWVHRLSHANN